jgi:hypothetical protein
MPMTVLTADALRSQLLAHLRAAESYSFLTKAEPYLRACPGDHYLRLMAVREYLKLGLVLPGKEHLDASECFADEPEGFAAIRQSLQGIRAVPIPWSEFSERFERNLGALAGQAIDVGAIRSAWERGHRHLQLFRDASGVEQIRARDEEGVWWWIPGLSHHPSVDSARPMPEGIGENAPGPYLFEGLDLGGFFERVYRATLNTFLGYSCALYVVEPNPTYFALVLHLRDWGDILADPRVLWCLGPDATEQLRQALDGDPDLPWPRQAFRLSGFRPGCDPSAVDVIMEAAARREEEIRFSLRQLNERYAGRDAAYWARRFEEALSGRGEPLRVLMAVSIHTTFLQHSVRDAARALESLGHRCMVLTEKTAHTVIGPLTYHRAIRELDPDVFLVLDHLRPEFQNLVPDNLPILTWDQDQLPHVFTKENMSRMARHDFVTGCSKSLWVRSGCDPRQYLHSRVPTCPEQFGGPPLTDEERARYECDVSYVSHAAQTPKAFHEQERAKCADPKLAAYLDAVYDLLPKLLKRYHVAGGAVMQAVLEEASRRTGILVRDVELIRWLRCWYVWRLGDRMFRHEALEWVAGWARRTNATFRIYGNGWERHPTLSEFAAGAVENGRELLCVYRASRINLQLMPAGFIHQRALDGLAAGGFFLTRLVPQDLRGRALRQLMGRIEELGITRTRDLLRHGDPRLQQALREYCGEWLGRADPESNELIDEIRLAAELLHPDEVFPEFDQIAFDSPETLAAAAERFLHDEQARRRVAQGMREVVLERFSYAPTINAFLRAMADYLHCLAFQS